MALGGRADALLDDLLDVAPDVLGLTLELGAAARGAATRGRAARGLRLGGWHLLPHSSRGVRGRGVWSGRLGRDSSSPTEHVFANPVLSSLLQRRSDFPGKTGRKGHNFVTS